MASGGNSDRIAYMAIQHATRGNNVALTQKSLEGRRERDPDDQCGVGLVESKIKAAAGFRLRLAAPSVFVRQRGIWRG
jgi:hypothetical protein